MEIRLDGKVALVTGGSAGIGRGIALALAQAGADVVVNYHGPHSVPEAEETAEAIGRLGRTATLVQADMADRDAIAAMFGRVEREVGRLDVLVNNAGIGGRGTGIEQPVEEWDRVLAVNLTAPFLCAQHAVRLMRAGGRGGTIVNITSVHEEAPGGGSAAYPVSKGGLRNLTRAIALQLAPEGILVTNVAPGMILSKMNGQAAGDPDVLARAEALIPVRRAGQPADIGQMVAFLASDLATYVTGSTVFVDGGWMLDWPPV